MRRLKREGGSTRELAGASVRTHWDTELDGVSPTWPVHMVLPCPVSWVPEVRPSSGEGALEKRSPGTAVPAGWQTQFTGGNASEPPARHNRP